MSEIKKKYHRGEMTIDLQDGPESTQAVKLAFKNRALSLIEEYMGSPFIKTIQDEMVFSTKFCNVAFWAGRMHYKSGAQAKAWTYDRACTVMDTHRDNGGEWQDLSSVFIECILENFFPHLLEKAEAEVASAPTDEEGNRVEDAINEPLPETSVKEDPTVTP